MIPQTKKKCSTEGHLNFRTMLRMLRDTDTELFNMAATIVSHDNWHTILDTLEEMRPELLADLSLFLEAAGKREEYVIQDEEAVPVKGRLREIAKELQATYKCDVGFLEAPTAKTVTVYLRHPETIIGLPQEVMRQSNRICKDLGSKRKWTFGFDNRIFICDLMPDAIEELRKNPMVEKIEVEDAVAYVMANCIPPYDPLIERMDWGVERIKPLNAWGKGLYGRGVKLCVLDTGIKTDHPEFSDNEGRNVYKGGWNFVANNNAPWDDHDHGTYCAGIAVAQHDNGPGYKGVAPFVDFYACKVLDAKGSGSLNNIAAAIDWCRTYKMNIISMSLGATGGASVLQAACDNAWHAGLILLAAAGNSGPRPNTVNWPAMYESCVAVGAIDYDEYVCSFSSRGPQVEVVAPGRYITGPWAGFTYKDYATPDKKYMCASGTSASTPHVAAAAALIKCWYPMMTNAEIRQWLRNHCKDL
ncbi:MAG: S8 family peptidase [Thermodesulfobacteriota bacterium]|nr:S8 family peptidase [Thermodesulfobacteriota bacterium]